MFGSADGESVTAPVDGTMYCWSDIPISSSSLNPCIVCTLALWANYLANIKHTKNTNKSVPVDLQEWFDIWGEHIGAKLVVLEDSIDLDHCLGMGDISFAMFLNDTQAGAYQCLLH